MHCVCYGKDIMQYDVIIIGAGPSGSSCAYNLKRFYPAAKILLLDKAVFPRYKPCGGGISPDVNNYFDFDLRDAVSCYSRELELVANQQVVRAACDMLMVRRECFDDFLVKKCRDRGVEIKLGCEVCDIENAASRVAVKTKESVFTGKIAVLAEGGSGKLARQLNIAPSNNVAGALEYEHFAHHDRILQIDFDQNKNGYAWVFPKVDGLSIGVGKFSRKKNNAERGLPQQLKKYLQEQGVQTLEKENVHGHPVQLYSGKKKLVYGRILLIGEIAGCVDPLTAEGIRPAIKSGYYAATLLSDLIAHDRIRALKKYNHIFHQMIGRDFQYARFVTYFLFRYFDKMLKTFCTPRAAAAFANVFSGRARYSDYIGWRMVKRFLRR